MCQIQINTYMKISEIITEVDMSRRSFLRRGAAALGAAAIGASAQSMMEPETDLAPGAGDLMRTDFEHGRPVDIGANRQLSRYRNWDNGTKFTGVDQRLTDRDTVGAGVGGGTKHGTVDFHAQHNFNDDGRNIRGSVEVDPTDSKKTRFGAKLNIPF
jgi:hypothetical protein